MWRQHFLDHNKVKHLPAGWRIDHKMERNFGARSVFSANAGAGAEAAVRESTSEPVAKADATTNESIPGAVVK